MGIMDWLKGAGQKVASGASWLGSNIIKPVSSFLKKVPVVGEVVKAADPLGQLAQKTADYAADALGNVPQAKRRAPPTLDDVQAGIGAIPKTVAAGLGAYGALKGGLGRMAAGTAL